MHIDLSAFGANWSKMIPSITERIDQNLSRVENLIAIYEDDSDRSQILRRRPHDTDILRAAVVLLHASLEDFLRGVLQWRLPTSPKDEIDSVPLLGQTQRHPAKFSLGALVEFRDWSVASLIDQSIKSYLDSWATFNDAGQVRAAISQSGLDADGFDYGSINEMIERRHNVVHKADALLVVSDASEYRVEPISIRKVQDYVSSVRGLKDHIIRQLKSVEYCPRINFSSYCDGLMILLESNVSTRKEFRQISGLSETRFNYLMQDMVTIGHLKSGPKRGQIESTVSTINDADELLRRFCRNHSVYRELLRSKTLYASFHQEDFYDVTRRMCGLTDPEKTSFIGRAKTLLRYFWGAGFIAKSGHDLELVERPLDGPYSIKSGAAFKHRRMNIFFGESPAPKLVDALTCMVKENKRYDELEIAGDKNCYHALSKFGLIGVDGRASIPSSRRKWSIERLVRSAAAENSVIKFVIDLVDEDPTIEGREIGEQVANEFDKKWKSSSKIRNGNALGGWAAWIINGEKAENPILIGSSQDLAKKIANLNPKQFGLLPAGRRFSGNKSLINHGRPPVMSKELSGAVLILKDEFGLTQSEIAKRIGVSRATIHRTIKLGDAHSL